MIIKRCFVLLAKSVVVAKQIVLVSIILLTSSCGIISDRSSDYVTADPGKSVVLPAHLSDSRLRSKYPVPDIENNRSLPVEFELPEPPDATAAVIAEPYMVETLAGETWLHLFSAPNNVWPLLDLFWNEYAMQLTFKDVRQGVLATQPLDGEKSSQEMMRELELEDDGVLVIEGMRFQMRTVHGVRRNTSEVQVRALLPNAIDVNPASWVAQSVNPRLERALLTLVGEFVTSEEVSNRHSLLAETIGASSRVRLLENPDGEGYLELDLSMARAKAELSQALDAAGIVFSSEQLDKGMFHISYLSQDDLDGWYHTESMNASRREEKNFSLELLPRDEGGVIVLVKKLNPEFDDDQLNDILNLVFEYIS